LAPGASMTLWPPPARGFPWCQPTPPPTTQPQTRRSGRELRASPVGGGDLPRFDATGRRRAPSVAPHVRRLPAARTTHSRRSPRRRRRRCHPPEPPLRRPKIPTGVTTSRNRPRNPRPRSWRRDSPSSAPAMAAAAQQPTPMLLRRGARTTGRGRNPRRPLHRRRGLQPASSLGATRRGGEEGWSGGGPLGFRPLGCLVGATRGEPPEGFNSIPRCIRIQFQPSTPCWVITKTRVITSFPTIKANKYT
jgi:hypothetical protein